MIFAHWLQPVELDGFDIDNLTSPVTELLPLTSVLTAVPGLNGAS
jgi:hypothetical protein